MQDYYVMHNCNSISNFLSVKLILGNRVPQLDSKRRSK